MLLRMIGIALSLAATPALGGHWPDAERPFTQTLSNISPLALGMTADEVAGALGSSMQYVTGRHGNETFVVIRSGGGFFARNDRLFLQFRRGRLTGFKGDWGNNWMWH